MRFLVVPFTTRVKATTRNLIKETTLPYVTFGFKNFITDLYWIRAVQDLISWDGKDLYYLNYFRNMSALDPSFEYPYLFDILVVPQNKNIDVLNAVGEISDRGIQAIPTSWKIPFYLGTQYYLFTRKYEPAEHYLGVAAKVKGAPEGVYLLYATYAAKKVPSPIHSEEDRRMVQELVKVIYNNTDNETIKKIALKGLQEAAITQMIEKGVFAYKVKYKKYPTSLNEIIK